MRNLRFIVHSGVASDSHLLEQGVDIRVIQVLLGHAKLDTTALYAQVATKTIHSVTSPLEKLYLQMEAPEPAG
jgi:integrase/recombinase XerD